MSASLLRRRRELVLDPESDVRRVEDGFVIEDLEPLIVAAPAGGPPPSGWVVIEHDSTAPFTLLFDQGRGFFGDGQGRETIKRDPFSQAQAQHQGFFFGFQRAEWRGFDGIFGGGIGLQIAVGDGGVADPGAAGVPDRQVGRAGGQTPTA